MLEKFPDVVRIETCGRCNFRCLHCPVGIYGGQRGVLKFDRFREIFNMLPGVPETLVLYHGGEPLINKELELIIFYAKHSGVKHTVFNSNAMLLSTERPRTLAEAGLDELRISFDGSSAEENDRIRIGAAFDVQARLVKRAAQWLDITIYNVKFDGDPKPAKYLTDYFGDVVKYRTEQARVWARDAEESPPNNVTYCEALFKTFTILSNGDVVSCCEDLLGDVVYGNVFEASPLDIWNSMQILRDDFADMNYRDMCKKCWIVTGRLMEQKP